MELVRFKSTNTAEGFTSLADYVERMGEDQKGIYYITGDNEDTLRNSPLLEAYKNKGWEVLIMDDEIDEIIVPTLGKYKEKDFKAINRSSSDEDLKTEEDKKKEEELKPVLDKIKEVLGEAVKDVISSVRLSDSPSCIVTDDNDPTAQMAQMLKAMGQADAAEIKPILEVNPDHAIVKKLQDTEDSQVIEDVSFLLLEQAMIAEGMMVKKPAEFVKRLNRVLGKSL